MNIKLETANPVRSFKGRGTEVVASLLAERGERAVVCASAGNLGQALAWSGRGRGLEVTVVASRLAPAAKLDRIRAPDARLELVDGDIEVVRERAVAIARHDGIRLVEDSLDIETCERAATIGLELIRATPSWLPWAAGPARRHHHLRQQRRPGRLSPLGRRSPVRRNTRAAAIHHVHYATSVVHLSNSLGPL